MASYGLSFHFYSRRPTGCLFILTHWILPGVCSFWPTWSYRVSVHFDPLDPTGCHCISTHWILPGVTAFWPKTSYWVFLYFGPRRPTGCFCILAQDVLLRVSAFWPMASYWVFLYFDPRRPTGCLHFDPRRPIRCLHSDPRSPTECLCMLILGVLLSGFSIQTTPVFRTDVSCSVSFDVFYAWCVTRSKVLVYSEIRSFQYVYFHATDINNTNSAGNVISCIVKSLQWVACTVLLLLICFVRRSAEGFFPKRSFDLFGNTNRTHCKMDLWLISHMTKNVGVQTDTSNVILPLAIHFQL